MINTELLRALSSRSLFWSSYSGHLVTELRCLSLVVRISFKPPFFIFLWWVCDILIGSWTCSFSRLSCSACPLMCSSCLFTSMALFSRSTFLQITWRSWNYSILNLSSSLLDFMDVLLECVGNLSWMLLSFGLVTWASRWLRLIYTILLIQIGFRLSLWRGQIGALRAAVRVLSDSLWLAFRIVNRIWRAFSWSIIWHLVFQIVGSVRFFTRISVTSALSMGMRRSSFNFVCCELL